MITQPAWINKELFPFNSKSIVIDGHSIHYIDEGASTANVILFVHGTPEWSFGFRDLIKALRADYRCIAIDHLGFGLSDKPQSADYSVRAHSNRLKTFIEKLGLTNISIVANDFGGGIAMGYVLDHPDNIKSITLFNTWMWSLRNDPHFSKPAKLVSTFVGRFLYKTLNAPVNMIMPSAYGDRKKLTSEVHDHYKKVAPNAASRVALYAIAQELMNASEWWESLWQRLNTIENKPILFFWGMKDKFVPLSALEKWKKRLPKAKYVGYPEAGHFVQEEMPDDMGAEIKKFLQE